MITFNEGGEGAAVLSDAPGKRTRSLLGQKRSRTQGRASTKISRKLTRGGTNVGTLCTNRNAGRYEQFLAVSVLKGQTCLE